MKDKVQKIREYLVGMAGAACCDAKTKKDIETNILPFIDSLQEEPVSNDVLGTVDKKARKIWNEINTGHEYSIIDSYNQFYGICMEIAEMVQEEPASEKKCMFTKDSYTDEDRKVLCEDCEEKCEYSKKEEPVSEDLEEIAGLYGANSVHKQYYDKNGMPTGIGSELADAVIYGAKWQKRQMIEGAKLSVWVARDEDGSLHIFEVEPKRLMLKYKHYWWDRDYDCAELDKDDFPDLGWEDEPVPVKVIIIKED